MTDTIACHGKSKKMLAEKRTANMKNRKQICIHGKGTLEGGHWRSPPGQFAGDERLRLKSLDGDLV